MYIYIYSEPLGPILTPRPQPNKPYRSHTTPQDRISTASYLVFVDGPERETKRSNPAQA